MPTYVWDDERGWIEPWLKKRAPVKRSHLPLPALQRDWDAPQRSPLTGRMLTSRGQWNAEKRQHQAIEIGDHFERHPIEKKPVELCDRKRAMDVKRAVETVMDKWNKPKKRRRRT